MELGRIERKKAKLSFDATNEDGQTVVLTQVDIALLAERSYPTSGTDWLAVTVSGGAAKFVLCGPDADDTGGAIRVVGTRDLWVRSTDVPEVDTELVERIEVV